MIQQRNCITFCTGQPAFIPLILAKSTRGEYNIKTARGEYGPIESDGVIVYTNQHGQLPARSERYEKLKKIVGANCAVVTTRPFLRVEYDGRRENFPAPRKGVFILIEPKFVAAARAMNRATLDDIIFPSKGEKKKLPDGREAMLYCQLLMLDTQT